MTAAAELSSARSALRSAFAFASECAAQLRKAEAAVRKAEDRARLAFSKAAVLTGERKEDAACSVPPVAFAWGEHGEKLEKLQGEQTPPPADADRILASIDELLTSLPPAEMRAFADQLAHRALQGRRGAGAREDAADDKDVGEELDSRRGARDRHAPRARHNVYRTAPREERAAAAVERRSSDESPRRAMTKMTRQVEEEEEEEAPVEEATAGDDKDAARRDLEARGILLPRARTRSPA